MDKKILKILMHSMRSGNCKISAMKNNSSLTGTLRTKIKSENNILKKGWLDGSRDANYP